MLYFNEVEEEMCMLPSLSEHEFIWKSECQDTLIHWEEIRSIYFILNVRE